MANDVTDISPDAQTNRITATFISAAVFLTVRAAAFTSAAAWTLPKDPA